MSKLQRPIKPAQTGSRTLTPAPYGYGYHVTNAEQLKKYQESGKIYAPVFAFTDLDRARDFRRRNNGRTIIVKFPLPEKHFDAPSPRHKSAILCQEAIPFNVLEEVTG